MKSFLTFTCLLLAVYSVWITFEWWPGPPKFTDLLEQKTSPDGLIVASFVLENYGGMTGTVFGLTLSGKQENPLVAEPVLLAEDNRFQYEWKRDGHLEIILPCGWWGRLTNMYRLRGIDHLINITYLPPSGCPQK